MSEAGAVSENGMSRRSSFQSLISGKSVYYTASELSTDDEFDKRSDSTREGSNSNVTGSGDTGGEDLVDGGGLTLEEVQASSKTNQLGAKMPRKDSEIEADTTSSTIGEDQSAALDSDEAESEAENEGDEGLDDVLKLCNEIAEPEQQDFQKQDEIQRACLEHKSVHYLRSLALSEGGLLTNALRIRAWPLLLGINPLDVEDQQRYKIPRYFPNVTEKTKEQVQMDVNRVLQRFPPNLSENQQCLIQDNLNNLILAVLQDNPEACYYQGFHDICITFLLVNLCKNVPYLAYLSLNEVVRGPLSPFMEKTMDSTNEITYVLYALLEVEDKGLYNKVVVESRCPAAFCLPWVITWFSHTLPNDSDIFRLSDFVLGATGKLKNGSLIPVFLSAALVLRFSRAIKEEVTETDFAFVHHALAQLPRRQNTIEPWLKDTLKLIEKYAGKEDQLEKRASEIKEYQAKLWDDEPATRQRREVAQNRSMMMYVSKLVFVKHRWITVAVVALGAAVVIQKYSSNSFLSPILSRLDSMIGARLFR